jgi:hypothetical protein
MGASVWPPPKAPEDVAKQRLALPGNIHIDKDGGQKASPHSEHNVSEQDATLRDTAPREPGKGPGSGSGHPGSGSAHPGSGHPGSGSGHPVGVIGSSPHPGQGHSLSDGSRAVVGGERSASGGGDGVERRDDTSTSGADSRMCCYPVSAAFLVFSSVSLSFLFCFFFPQFSSVDFFFQFTSPQFYSLLASLLVFPSFFGFIC